MAYPYWDSAGLPPYEEGSVLNGFLAVAGLNGLVAIVGLMFGPPGLYGVEGVWRYAALVLLWNFALIGLGQLVYVVPMYLHFRKTGRKRTATGLIIAASITALLNAACWGTFGGW